MLVLDTEKEKGIISNWSKYISYLPASLAGASLVIIGVGIDKPIAAIVLVGLNHQHQLHPHCS